MLLTQYSTLQVGTRGTQASGWLETSLVWDDKQEDVGRESAMMLVFQGATAQGEGSRRNKGADSAMGLPTLAITWKVW